MVRLRVSAHRPDADGSADPAFLVEVDDSEIAGKYLDEIISRANAYFRAQRPGNGPPVLAFERCLHLTTASA